MITFGRDCIQSYYTKLTQSTAVPVNATLNVSPGTGSLEILFPGTQRQHASLAGQCVNSTQAPRL